MKINFAQIMTWLAVYEGGFVNHPRDPGGATNRGVTQRVYDAFRRNGGKRPRSVRQLTDAEHDAIYLRQYWMPIRGDSLPSGVDASVFDFAVNSGVSRAAKTLQRALGVRADGVVGEVTLAAIDNVLNAGKLTDLIVDYNRRRMGFLRRLSTFSTFGKGWTRRVMGAETGAQLGDIGVVDRSIMLAHAKRGIPLPRRTGEGKADDRDLGFIGAIIEAVIDFVEALFKNRKRGNA